MPALEKDQLEALRNRVEEDFRRAEENYRLDVAAIEHLERRFFSATSNIPTGNYSPPSNGPSSESPITIPPPHSAPPGPQGDGLEGSLRSIFASSRR